MEHLGGPIDAHQDISKGVSRSTIQPGDNASLHCITSTGLGHNDREQEYIESTLLGTDLYSSQLPTNLLNEYINSVSTTVSSSIGSMQSALMEHHYRPFSDELLTLNNEPGNETSIMVNETKDIPGFSTLASYDKMMTAGQSSSPMGSGLAQMAGAIDGYVHYPLSGSLHSTGAGNDGFDMVPGTLGPAHSLHQPDEQHQQHHYGLPHSASSHHHQHQGQAHVHRQPNIMNVSNPGSQHLPPMQQQHPISLGTSESSSNLNPLLSSVDVRIKGFGHSNSILPVTSAAPASSDVHSGPVITIPSIACNESQKRFFSCPTLPSLITHNQRLSFSVADNLLTTKNVSINMIECESRPHEEDITDCVTSLENASCPLLRKINLPHKKRLAKKLGDSKESDGNGNGEMIESLVLTADQPQQGSSNEYVDKSANCPSKLSIGHNADSRNNAATSADNIHQSSPVGSFSCQICGQVVQDQLAFFNHLKAHYEPSNTANGATSDSTSNDNPTNPSIMNSTETSFEKVSVDVKRPKPKLPRVKHTKKLKNDRTTKPTENQDETQSQRNAHKDATSVAKKPNHGLKETKGTSMDHSPMIGPECMENCEEFSETEDMLEGIQSVVQKVQEAVDTDTNEELCLGSERAWFPSGPGDDEANINGNMTISIQEPQKRQIAGGALEPQDCHIENGENILFLLSRTQFNESEIVQTAATDSKSLKPLKSVPYEPIAHKIVVDENARDGRYVSARKEHKQPIVLLRPAACNDKGTTASVTTSFPVLPNVGVFSEDTPSYRERDALPIPSILALPSDADSKRAKMSFPMQHRTRLDDVGKPKLLKDEQKSDDDEEENDDIVDNCDETAYVEMELANIDEADVERLDDLASGGGDAEMVDYSFSSDELDELSIDAEAEEAQKAQLPSKPLEAGGKGSTKGKEILIQEINSKSCKYYLCLENDCGRQFNSKTAISYHRLQHTGERPHKCNSCDKRFFTCSALKVHERLHSGEKPYECDECGHFFRQWGDLKYHKISKHSNEKSHKCEFCSKEFARRYSLVLHRRIHTNEKNYVCDFCNKAFRASSYLQSHRMIHTGEKPHQCNICLRKFRCHGDLNRHKKTHSCIKKSRKVEGNDGMSEEDDGKQVDQREVERSGSIGEGKTKPKRQRNNNSIVIL